MKQLSAFFIAISAALWAPAHAEQYFTSPGNHAKFEAEGPLKIVIGAQAGRNYFLAVNRGATEISYEINVKRLIDPNNGAVSTQDHAFALGGYSTSGMVFLDTLHDEKSWINGWSLKDVSDVETRIGDRDATPVLRLPPAYPGACMQDAAPQEHSLFYYDVSETGELENIRLRNTTNGCLYHAAFRQLKSWVFLPAIKGGKPVRAEQLETVLTFVLEE